MRFTVMNPQLVEGDVSDNEVACRSREDVDRWVDCGLDVWWAGLV